MFDQRILLAGSEDSAAGVPLPHSRVIFVLEDIDAASTVVQRREPSTSAATTSNAAADAVMVAAAIAASSTSGVSSLEIESGSGSGSARSSVGNTNEVNYSTSNCNNGEPVPSDVSAGSGCGAIGPLSLSDLLKGSATDNDKLNLAGLLNVLDGENRLWKYLLC